MEHWKNYNENYQVSNYGNVRSVDRVVRKKRGLYKLKGILLKQVTTDHGYKQVSLGRQHSKKYVHRLVCEVFLPDGVKECINHKGGNKSNNHVSNLEWTTLAENTRHAFATGLMDEYLNRRGSKTYK